MKRINYKSDFDFVLKLVSCVKAEDGTITKTEVGFPDHDWTATFWTSSKANAYVASSKGGVLTNCFNDDGQIHIVCNAHKLGVGELKCEYHAALPNVMYPDGSCDVYEPQELDIELWTGQSDCPTEMVVEMGLSAMYRSVYEDAVQAGFKGTKEEYYQRLSELPDSVEVATTIRQSVEDINEASKNISAMVADIGSMASDMTAGKKRVIDALASRGYELPADVSYNEMADVIEHMTWGEGILAKIGYEGEEDYELLSQEIERSYRTKQLYESGEIDSLYDCGLFAPKVKVRDGNADYLFCDKTNTNNKNSNLLYVPKLEGVKSAECMFKNCASLKELPSLDYSTFEDARSIFSGCTSLQSVDELNLNNAVKLDRAFEKCETLNSINGIILSDFVSAEWMFNYCQQLESIVNVDVGGVYAAEYFFWQCTSLTTIKLENIGKSYHMWDFGACKLLGTTDEESRQSVIYTLLTHSYDRAANGLSAGKITLHANTKARLTDEEKAAITAKGFTIA